MFDFDPDGLPPLAAEAEAGSIYAAHRPNIVMVRSTPQLPNGMRYHADVPFFIGYQVPDGFLLPLPECHALFLYNLMARNVYEQYIKDPIFLEGSEGDLERPEFLNIIKLCAAWYETKFEEMVKHWETVTHQCKRIMIPMVPDEERYRFNRTPEIFLQ